jgi:hypothetical protein
MSLLFILLFYPPPPPMATTQGPLTAAEFFLTCDVDMLAAMFRERLDLKSRTALLAMNKKIRHRILHNCRRAVDSHVTYESYMRKRVRTMLAIESPNQHDSVYELDVYAASMPPMLPTDLIASDMMTLFTNETVSAILKNPRTNTPQYSLGVTYSGADRHTGFVMEATLRPTTDMLLPELAEPANQARLRDGGHTGIALPDRVTAAVLQTAFTLRPNATGLHQTRGIGVVRNQGYRSVVLDTLAARPVSHMLESFMYDPAAVSESNASVFVILGTPLSHVLARQSRSWLGYMGRLRALCAQDGTADPISIEQRLQQDDALAIRGLFVTHGAFTVTHNETGRKKTALVVSYIGLPMDRVVHRVE